MLELDHLVKHFGGVRAVDGVSLNVTAGEVLGLIGPNGSGKSTMVNLICGLFPLTAGRVIFKGQDISNLPPHERVSLGIARTFQNIRLFGQLTVWQNLWVAQNSAEQRRDNPLRRWFGGGRRAREEAGRVLEFFDLAHKRDELAGTVARTHRAVERAHERAVRATPVERALIEALRARYPQAEAVEDCSVWNEPYADRMLAVHENAPGDPDVATLCADALMNLTPWRLWDLKAGRPADGARTLEAKAVLDGRSQTFTPDELAAQAPTLPELTDAVAVTTLAGVRAGSDVLVQVSVYATPDGVYVVRGTEHGEDGAPVTLTLSEVGPATVRRLPLELLGR